MAAPEINTSPAQDVCKSMKAIKRNAIAAVIAVAILAPGLAQGGNQHITPSQLQFRNTMRKLWEDHVTWTRCFLISAIAHLPDREATTARLLQNQVDIGNAVKPYYGHAAGNQLT